MARGRALAMDAPAAPRERTRQTAPAVPATVVELAQQAFAANQEKNKATSAEKAAQKALNKAMVAANIDRFDFTGSFNGANIPAEAVIEETPCDVIDVNVLRTLVDDDTFMRIVSATKTACDAEAGENTTIRATKTIVKPASLKVRKKKV
jgi:hypothetical protein